MTSARDQARAPFVVPNTRARALDRLRQRVCIINFRTMATLCGWPLRKLGPDEVPGVRWADRENSTCVDCLAKLAMHEKTKTTP